MASAGIFGWFSYTYRSFALSGGYPETIHIVVAGVAITLVFAAGFLRSRSLAVLAAIFFAYNFFGAILPGALGHGGFTFRRVLAHLFWGSNGIFGVGVGVSSTYIFMFVLFGALHWPCDLVWLEILSVASYKGTEVLGGRLQQAALLVCGIMLVAFGVMFLRDAWLGLMGTA